MKITIQKSSKYFFLCFFILGISMSFNAQHFTFDTELGDVNGQASSVVLAYKTVSTEGHTGIMEMTTINGVGSPRVTISKTNKIIDAANLWVKIVYRAQAGVAVHKFRVNNGGGNITAPNNVLISDSTWRTYWFDLTGQANWSAVKSDVNFFLIGGTPSGAFTFEVDEISFVTRTTADGAIPVLANASINIEHEVTSASDITIPTDATYRIEPNKSLDITGNLVTNDGLSIESGGSLKVSGTSTGDITYKRGLDFVSGNLKGWHLVSSPVVGENYNTAWYTANDIASGSGTNRGIASYATGADSWSYVLEANDDAFTDGVGYIMKRGTATGVVSFTGTLNVSDLGASIGLTAGTDKFHAVGNPYPSYMSSATFLGNAALSETQEIYVFDQTVGTNGGYTTKTFAMDFTIAPGQGFFVKGNVAGGLVTFAKSNQMTGTDTFLKSSKAEVKLTLKSGSVKNYAQVYYLDNATTGFDNGYEGETFGGIPNDFEIFTHLIDGNQGKNYQVQSLPNSDLETMVIPVGIKTTAGKITFTAEALNLPTDIKVFLEDRANNVFTRLDEANSNYEVTLSEAINGVGRFYLHTSAKSSLSVDNIELQGVSIFKSSASTLKIAGLQQGKASVSLFNIQGKQILSSSFNANGVKEISLPRLATGVYFAKVQTATGKINKKIILE